MCKVKGAALAVVMEAVSVPLSVSAMTMVVGIVGDNSGGRHSHS